MSWSTCHRGVTVCHGVCGGLPVMEVLLHEVVYCQGVTV